MSFVPAFKPNTSAFGEAISAELSPVAQIVATYGFPAAATTISTGDGSTGVADKMFTCSSGTAGSQLSSVATRAHVKYRAGQGVMVRGTAI